LFYSLIENKRNDWFNSDECTIKELIKYIENQGKMRDAQIEAIKTYLFLKIKCENKPLWQLFYEGAFNSLDVDNLEIKQQLKEYFIKNPCSLSLYQYAITKKRGSKDDNEIVSPSLEKEIKDKFDDIDYKKVFQDIFNNVDYTDYLYSLPMGAGKTYLMASFIYLDLYFSLNEPNNKSFAHNFIIFAPSGLKSSIIPSLKTIQKFKPSWILPEPAASNIKRIIKFEILDEVKSGDKSNKTKNPNVQKVAQYQPYEYLFGLIAITNAEKVILDKTINYCENSLLSKSELDNYNIQNELRSHIAKIPNLSIFIDEVHHTTKEENKLRTVVTNWAKSGHFINSIVGFSGTPYLEKAVSIKITEKLQLKNSDITNVVYYYPLLDGIGNFLKKPIVKIPAIRDSLEIVEMGVREFLDKYQNKIYSNNTCAKLGIYCGSVKNLEEKIYPKISEIITEKKYNLNPDEVVLKFYRSNKEYTEPQNAQLEFDSLDKPISKIKIILLVQIGKEGWDCKSLTGIILTQESDCDKKMVLQTSCRCLRQVTKHDDESAIIYLNEGNAKILNSQLQKQQHIGIKDLQTGKGQKIYQINRYSRMDKKNLPLIDFYQLRIQSDTIKIENQDISKSIRESISNTKLFGIITTQDFEGNIEIDKTDEYGNEIADFDLWLFKISKSSFNKISLKELYKYNNELQYVFNKITYNKDNNIYFSSKYDIARVEANIRKSFSPIVTFDTKEDIVPQSANLLLVEKLTNPIETFHPQSFTPEQYEVETIINDDMGKLQISDDVKKSIEIFRANGFEEEANKLEQKYTPNSDKDKTYHYLPYKTDSEFEIEFLNQILESKPFKNSDLEILYNGDEILTEFTIKTYKNNEFGWQYIGNYTPDFLILKRKSNKIYQVLVVETKGEGFAKNFVDKKNFMEKFFVPKNNEKFGYGRFEFLYLQDNLTRPERIDITINKIEDFFKENA